MILVASSFTSAVATPTSGTARTRSRAVAGIVGELKPSSVLWSNSCLAFTTASVPPYEASESSSAALSIVSVSV
jgi:hypothetical protein